MRAVGDRTSARRPVSAVAAAAPTHRRLGQGTLIAGAWGADPLPVDSRGWGWMTQVVRQRRLQASVLEQGEGTAVQRQAGHQLHDQHVRSGLLLRGPQALRLRLVRDAAQHDVVGRRREDDRGVPWPRRRRADDPHAGSARVEHSEGDRPRRDRIDLPDDPRRSSGAGSGALLALSAVWPPQFGIRTGRPRSGRVCRAATRTPSTTTCSSS